jgi:hypothetical protein
MTASRHEDENIAHKDCVLPPGSTTWITVGNLSVHLKHGDEGLSISIYPDGREMHDSIAENWVLFSEAETEENEDAGE